MTTEARPQRLNLRVQLIEQPEAVGWADDEEGGARLPVQYVGTLLINTRHHHVTLFRIERDENGNPVAPDGHNEQLLDALCDFEGEYDFQSLAVGDEEYLLVVTPYAQ